MLPTNNAIALLWWGGYTILCIWGQRMLPGIDFFAPGFIICLQRESALKTFWLTLIWILLLEGTGNLPFGYGLAWYGCLAGFYYAGRWLFEKRSFLFMGLLGLGLGIIHPLLIYGLGALAKLVIPLQPVFIEGGLQVIAFPLIWLVVDFFYPTRLKRDVATLS